MRTHPLPPPDSDCVMQDVKLHLLNLQWFRVLGASFSRFECFVFEILGSSFSSFGCFVLEIWGSSFSSFGCFVFYLGCFVFEIWVLHASVFVFECFVFETTIPRDYHI